MITIKKEILAAEPELSELVLSYLGAYVSIKDQNKKYVYANRKLKALFIENFDTILGCVDSQLFDCSSHTDMVESDDRVLNFGDNFENEEIVIIKSTGEKKVYWSSKQPIVNTHKKIVGVLCVSTEITDLHVRQKRLEIEATTDSLTGLFNRRFFFELADKFFSESSRHHNALSLIMLDIDFFKEINDKYGHPIGDKVIQFVASKTQSLLRKEDTIARIGGEEYLILLPNTDGKTAKLIAEKIRSFIDSQSITGDWTGTIYPKISLGVSTYSDGDFDFNEIYVRCDRALYHAKLTGRNKICMFEKHMGSVKYFN